MDNQIRQKIDEVLDDSDLNHWLELWAASQSAAGQTGRRFTKMVEALGFSEDQDFFALDMCCGPGDLGREILQRYPNVKFDFVDRDYFLLAMCRKVNKARNIPGTFFERDGWQAGWHEGLRTDYQLIAASTALHWFDVERLQQLFQDFHSMLANGGQLIFREPVSQENLEEAIDLGPWKRFWEEVNSKLNYSYSHTFLQVCPEGKTPINDDGLPAEKYTEMLQTAGFSKIEIVFYELPMVIITAYK